MKKSRLTDSQIIAVLKQAKAGMSVLYLWRDYPWSRSSLGVDVLV